MIDPVEIVNTYGLDQVRYFLLREVPFGNDGDYSHRAVIGRINNDLANDFGNLSQRVLSMINRNCDAKVPRLGTLTDADNALMASAHGLLPALRRLFAEQAFHRALIALWEVVGQANRYVDEQAPWTLKKTDPERMATVLYVLAETVRHLAVLAQPVMPESCAKMLEQLSVEEGARDFSRLGPDGALKPGTPLPKPQPVFPRIVEDD